MNQDLGDKSDASDARERLAANDVHDVSDIRVLRKSLGVVLPAYNEEKCIRPVLEELDRAVNTLGMDCQIIVVDDGSSDSTFKQALNARLKTPLKVVRLSRNFGKEIAITAGLNEALSKDVVVIMDADGQHPPSKIRDFIACWKQGYDHVYAVRQSRKTDTLLRRCMSSLFYKLLPRDSQFIEHDAGDFRLLSARLVGALTQMQEKNRFMKGLYNWVGFRKKGLPYVARPRINGETKFTLRALINFAVIGITAFSTLPLRIISRLGFLISGMSFAYGLYVFLRTLIFGVDLQGWATLVDGVTFLSGIQLISIGVLGEYVGRIFVEVKNRPLYLIDEVATAEPEYDSRVA